VILFDWLNGEQSMAMTHAERFLHRFDEDGRWEDKTGDVTVELLDDNGEVKKGSLHFVEGYCVRVEMDGASPWENHDKSPLNQLHLRLHFEGERKGLMIDRGRIVLHYTPDVPK